MYTPSEEFATMDPATFAPLDGVPDLLAVARDANLRATWCNDAFAAFFNTTPAAILGTTAAELLPHSIAQDRTDRLREVVNTRQRVHYFQFLGGQRFRTRVWPTAPADPPGCFALLQPAPIAYGTDATVPTLPIPDFAKLSAISARELEVWWLLAAGHSVKQVAAKLFRSAKTIEAHLAHLHAKTGIANRAELTRVAVERGITAFTWEEWKQLAQARVEDPRAMHHRGPLGTPLNAPIDAPLDTPMAAATPAGAKAPANATIHRN